MNKGYGVSMEGVSYSSTGTRSGTDQRAAATSPGGERQTTESQKCFVFNPDGSVYCIGWNYGGDECYCRVYPQQAALGALARGEQLIYGQNGTPIRRVLGERGEALIDIPPEIVEKMPTIDPLPPEVVATGSGTLIKDPRSGELVFEPGEEPNGKPKANGNGKGGGIEIMGQKIPLWVLLLGGYMVLK